MSHKNRIWFVETLTKCTYLFVVTNFQGCADETSAYDGVVVEEDGRKKRKGLYEITPEQVEILKKNAKAFNLDFKLFMAEGRNSPIRPWKM